MIFLSIIVVFLYFRLYLRVYIRVYILLELFPCTLTMFFRRNSDLTLHLLVLVQHFLPTITFFLRYGALLFIVSFKNGYDYLLQLRTIAYNCLQLYL